MTARVEHVGSRKWQNWHQSVEQRVADLIDLWNATPNQFSIQSYNATTDAMQGLIQSAMDQRIALRALGGGWSFSPVAATDGILLNTRPLNYKIAMGQTNLMPGCVIDPANLALLQCGNSIAQLNAYLASKGKSLRTTGASNGQTIAGAVSTGTHGSALGVGAVPEMVRAIHLVCTPDRHVWLERASQPIVTQALVDHLHAELIRDDALFNAALVSFGSFGVIHSLLLEVENIFWLQGYRSRRPLDASLRLAIGALDFSGLQLPRPAPAVPSHFNVVANPHDPSAVYVTLMYKHAARPADCQEPPPGSKFRQGDSALEVLGVITDLVSELTPALAGTVLAQAQRDVNGICGTHGETFGDTTTRGKAASSAMGIPLTHALQAFDLAMRIAREGGFAGFVALRYVSPGAGTLAFTRFAPHTCVLEVDGPRTRRTSKVFRDVWKAFVQQGIPHTFHWGKMSELDNQGVRRAYGDASVDAWLAARRALLPTPRLRSTFANNFLKAAGLAD